MKRAALIWLLTMSLIGLLALAVAQVIQPTVAPEAAPTSSGSAAAGWLVSASTVGLAPLGLSCASLPVYTGPSQVARGTVISNVRVTTPLDLSAGGITVQRSCIQPTSVGRGLPVLHTTNYNTWTIASERVVVRDSEIDGSKLTKELAAWSAGFLGVADLISNYVHGFGSGIAVMYAENNLDVLVERNYVTGLVAWGDPSTTGNHSDAFTVRDFDVSTRPDRQLMIRNNRFDCHSGSDTGALFIQAYSGPIANMSIQGNLLEGMGYQLALEANRYGYSNVRAVNNRFSGTGYGPGYVAGGPGWMDWQDNYRYNPTATDGRGTPIPKP